MCDITEILHGYPKKHGISISEIADNIGVPSSTLERMLNPNDSYPFSVRLLIPFCNSCNQDYTAIDHMEARFGRVAFSIPRKNEDVGIKAIGSLAKKSGEALSVMADALADGVIDEQEKKDLIRVLISLSQRVNEILGRLVE